MKEARVMLILGTLAVAVAIAFPVTPCDPPRGICLALGLLMLWLSWQMYRHPHILLEHEYDHIVMGVIVQIGLLGFLLGWRIGASVVLGTSCLGF